MNKETYTLTMVDGMRISDVNMSGNKLLGITNLFTVGNVEVVKEPRAPCSVPEPLAAKLPWIRRKGKATR